MNFIKIFTVHIFLISIVYCMKNEKRALQKSHERPQIDKLMDTFLLNKKNIYNSNTIADLLIRIANEHLSKCNTIFLYDDTKHEYFSLIEDIFRKLNATLTHGLIDNYRNKANKQFEMRQLDNQCVNYVLFVKDVISSQYLLGKQDISKVIILTKSSQWRVNEFLLSESSRYLINLLIIAPSNINSMDENEITYILYTHELYVDGLGASLPVVLTSWRNGSLTRPDVKLFTPKMKSGFSGHRFLTSVAHQPPFVIKKGLDDNDDVVWDGIEIRLLRLLSNLYNFTVDIKNAKDDVLKSPADKVVDNVHDGTTNVGVSGIYLTAERLEILDTSYPHSFDCAAFISLTSTALSKYRAIMGPFNWTVWLALIIIYLFAIIPLAFADRHTLRHLFANPEEIENMFWYVFGTFTNCFTFGVDTWTKSAKITPRLLMGFYWLFTIIITACYTGSIIAFITVPVYPSTIDTVQQLLSGRYQIGTLDRGGWEYWFNSISDKSAQKLLKNMELLPDVQSGLRNITKAWLWPYAFLGSRAELDYIVRTNFTTTNKRSLLHISSECFAPFGVSIVFAKRTIYKNIIDKGISYISQSGFITKFENDIRWEFMRSPTGKLLQANNGGNLRHLFMEDRSLSIDDTQGTFLLLAGGFILGAASLIVETLGGCYNCFKRIRKVRSITSISTNPRSYDSPTPRDRLNSIYPINEFQSPGKYDEEIDCVSQDDEHNETQETNKGKKLSFEEIFGEENLNTEETISN